jgi:TRAP-type C4-dicarboxylate transport system substrate-binding protein
MHWMKRPARLRLVGLFVIMTVLTSVACGAGASGDKAGGPGEAVVLHMANTGAHIQFTPAIEYFVSRVEEISDGNLRIGMVHEWGDFSPDAEQQVVRAVSAGEVDLGWSGTRVFDTMGVTTLQALTAPMLIDSYALEDAVIRSGITEQMLRGLDEVGVTGLAVVADGLRKPIAVDGPLLGPEDYHGLTFQAFRSEGHAEAIRALGANPTEVFGPSLDDGLENGEIQGFEKNLLVYEHNLMYTLAPYVTANVNLWPQMPVLFANPDRFATLTEEQRGWLRRAAADAAARSAALADRDAQLLTFLCESGARFANASEADLAALRRAFAPVYSMLERDPETKAFIERIEELKLATPPGPQLAIPPGCSGPAPAASAVSPEGVASDLNGTYRWTITKEDALASETEDKSPEHLAEFPWVFTMTLEDGTWKLTHTEVGEPYTDSPGDTYSIRGDRIIFDWEDYILTFTFSVDDQGNLEVRPVEPMGAGEQFVWATHPWTKIG